MARVGWAPEFDALAAHGVLLTTSPAKSARLALATGGLGAFSFLILFVAGPPLPLLWIPALAGFGLGVTATTVFIAQLPRPWPVLGIDRRGLWFGYVGLVPWEEIERLWIRRPLLQRVLSGTPMDMSILNRQPGRRGMLDWISVGAGQKRFNMWDQQLSVSLDELVALMRSYYPVDRLFAPDSDPASTRRD